MGDGLVGTTYVDDRTVAVVLDGDLREVSRADVRGGTLAVTPDGDDRRRGSGPTAARTSWSAAARQE